jgi:protein SCO1
MSTRSNTPVRIIAWAVLAAVLGTVAFLFLRSQLNRSSLPALGQVQPFALTNQLGAAITARDLRGRVWVADIIFTRCPGPCPRMTEEMKKLQNAFSASDPLSFVTLTTDPDYDTPAILKKYSERFGADHSRWFFLTGPKSEIRNVAVGSLKLATVDKEESERQNPNDLFIHSTIFVIVDKNGVMRAVHESLEDGFQEKIRADIQSLLRES